MPEVGFWYWVRASYYDPVSAKESQAFSGPWQTDAEASQWAAQRYASLPGAMYSVCKSRSRDRNTARNETRHSMIESGEGAVPDVLRVRFRNQSKED